MTLALLLTAVTGAWAQSTLNVVELEVPAAWETDGTKVTEDDFPGFDGITIDQAKTWTGAPSSGLAVLFYNFDGEDISYAYFLNGAFNSSGADILQRMNIYDDFANGAKHYYTASATGIEGAIEVAWNASTKTGTFSMPGSDVVLTPQYAPAAKWDVVETVEQLPAALEGIIAGQDAAIVTAGQSAQGTVMYAVTTSAEPAPALTAFSATVPTAKDYDDATTLYVWYYIQGQDTPDGQQATEENTFNDSEISTTPLTVQVLTNKFDLTLNAANANTIEAGKATVTVGGTAATVTEGKLQGVKMGSEVKMTAKQGYKFRKVEVKKKGVGPVTYTELKGGEVLHVGDILDFSDSNVEYLFSGFALSKLKSPYTVLRANIDGEPWDPTVTLADDGAYYLIQGKNGYYAFVYDLPATATSDGILITINSEDGDFRNCTASVHEP